MDNMTIRIQSLTATFSIKTDCHYTEGRILVIKQTFVILNVVLLNVMEPRKRRSCFIRRMDIKLYRPYFLSKQRNKKY